MVDHYSLFPGLFPVLFTHSLLVFFMKTWCRPVKSGSYSFMYWYISCVGSMLVIVAWWLIKAAVCRRPLRCLRRGSCCSHTSHCRWHTSHPSSCRLVARIHRTHSTFNTNGVQTTPFDLSSSTIVPVSETAKALAAPLQPAHDSAQKVEFHNGLCHYPSSSSLHVHPRPRCLFDVAGNNC